MRSSHVKAVIFIWGVAFGALQGAELELTSATSTDPELTSVASTKSELTSVASTKSELTSAASSELELKSTTELELQSSSNAELEPTSDISVGRTTDLVKPGVCARPPPAFQLKCREAESQCDSDGDCQEDQKCCNNGCRNVCTYPAFTGCQQMRTLLSKQSDAIDDASRVHVPTCQDNGRFEDVQCDERIGKCWCVDDLGFELAGTRENSSYLVNCSNPKPCADVLCRMLCPYGFELDTEGCPLCRCRNPCSSVHCPAEQECQLEEIPCAEEICPPLPTCKQPRRLEDLCPMGTPLSSPESGNPFLCGMQPNKPQCPPNYLCDVMPGNDYGVCCPLIDKHGRCPTELHFGDTCGPPCNADMDCHSVDKCCTIEGCGMTCIKPANTTLCLQQKAVVELLLSGRAEFEGYIPQCTEDGEFIPMQCSSNGHLCWCVTINGTIIAGTMAPREKVECERRKLELEGRTESEGRTYEIDVSFVCDQLDCGHKCEGGFKYDGKGCRTCECLEPCKDVICPDGKECILTRDDNCFDNDCPLIPFCRDIFLECNWGRALLSNVTNSIIHCQENECPDTHFCEVKQANGLCCPKQVEIEHTKDSECPDYIYEPNQCDHICKSDSHCGGALKCCPSKACGTVCVPPKPPKPPTMCEYIRDSGKSLVRPDGNVTLAIPQPQCLRSGAYNPMQCDEGQCWCVDEFGVEITKTRTTDSNLDCNQIREEMACLGLICRLGCDFGFVMDEEGCPLCSCRNPCQNASCGEGGSCQFLEVECDDDWCPPLPYCVPSEAVARNFPECPMGSPMLYEYGNEPVMCDPFSNYPQCPETHDCVVSNPRDLGVCCPRVDDILPNEEERRGQCPYLIPVLGESCDYQCSSDDDCNENKKCCSNGCGTQCVDPVMKTACQHLKSAAEHRAIEMGIPASRVYMPNCTESGGFTPVQCSPENRNCWCVDESGLEVPGTRVMKREDITCVPVVDTCTPMSCDSMCPHGHEIDDDGCLTCDCNDPCKDIKCRNSVESCRLVTVNCITEPCTPLPLCLPKIENPCPIGDPLTDGEFSSIVQCGPQGQQCPSSHRCHLSPFGEYAVCCPKPIISTCEQLKKRNQLLRKATNRVTFLPKCNKKTAAWDPTQCMEALGLCWCVDPEGNQLPGTLIRGVPHCTARSGKSLTDTPICSNGDAVHLCPSDLCKRKICLGYPNATCNIDPCGGCKVQFLDDFNRPVDCNNGLTACFAEVQDVINTGVLRPRNTVDDDVLPDLEYMVEETIPLPPPIYPPPPPPPQFPKLSRREAVFDYDYNHNDVFEYEGPDYDEMQAMQASDPSIIMLPRVQSVQIKMLPQFSALQLPPMSPAIDQMPIQALGEFMGPEPVEVYGISHRFTFMDNPTIQSFRDNSDPYMQPYASSERPGQCPLPNLFSILRSMVNGQSFRCEHSCRLDSDCEWPNKCCLYNFCGLQCHPPEWKTESRQDEEKCPVSEASIHPFMCLFAKKSCIGDQDCGINERCCTAACGSQCITIQGKKREVKPVKLQAAAPRCSVEGGYAITQKQGELSWCVDQYGQPLHNTLTRGSVECDNNGTVISLHRSGPVCQDRNKVPKVCKEECLQADCPTHPDAICVANPCNDCAIEFVSVYGNPVSCEGKCKQPLMAGNCGSSFPRYFFNQSSQRCEQFIYTGCQGNHNNFEMLESCQEECEKEVPRCDQPKEVGFCRAQMFRWFYNKNTHQCEQFIYGGCRGNKNNFETHAECEKTCPELVLCPWINVNGEDIIPCNRSAACANVTCPGKPEAICTVDSCSCQPFFFDYEGHLLTCSLEQHIAEESSPTLRTAALSQITRCQNMLKRHLLSGDAAYIPLCNEKGEFYPMQCSREKDSKNTQCWCVDEAGMQLPSSQKFVKGTKNCKFIQVKKVEVTLAFTHKDINYAETMKPAIKRLIEQFLVDLGAEFSDIKISVLPGVAHVMFTLLSDNKVQIAFQLEEMMKMESIFIVLPKAEMSVDYHSSHFYHVLEYSSDTENAIAADRITEFLTVRSEYNWPFFAIFLSIACMILFLIFYVIPVIIRKRKKDKELELEEKEKPSLLSVVFRTFRYNLTGKKENVIPPVEEPKIVVQTVEAEYESLQKQNETEKQESDRKSQSSEAPPAYDDISEKGGEMEKEEKEKQ